MIALTVPGWGEVRVAHLVLDYNGTLAAGGVLLPGVAPRLEAIHRLGVSLHIVTADTNGTAAQQCAALPVELLVREGGAVAREKAALVERLDPAETAAVGNGRNDVDMLRAAGLSLAVIGDEGGLFRRPAGRPCGMPEHHRGPGPAPAAPPPESLPAGLTIS